MDWVQDEFPNAQVSFPGDAYARIVHPLGAGAERDPELSRLEGNGLMLDLETLGFHGRPLFLIGLLHRPEPDGPWAVVQLLARDYAEEDAVILAFARAARKHTQWLSFNGKAFDLPFLKNRATFYGLPLPIPEEHLDLLHAARRVYRGVLPDCKLKTLELRIFGRYRERDLDGGEIPRAYHDYVRTGIADEMVRILLHNREDLVTLARLHVHLADP